MTGDGSSIARRNDKPGSEAFYSHEVGEEAETSGELAPLSGGNAAHDALQHSVDQGDGLARSLKVVGGDEATERWSRLSQTEAAVADRVP